MLAKQPVDRWPSIPEALAALGAGPLARDDPIRGELKRLAKWPSPGQSPLPTRLTLRVPERLEVGESMGCEVYAINGTDTSPQRVTATWRVTDDAVAEFDTVNGLLQARKVGIVTITAETAQGSVDAQVEVIAATVSDVVFALPSPAMSIGETVQLVADVRDRRGGRVADAVTWSVTDPSIASISIDGVVSALSVGSASIVARVGSVSSERTLFVQESNAASIVIRGGRPSVTVGETVLFSVDVFDAQNRRLAARDLRWTSSNDTVARVDRLGTVRAITPGAITITASCGTATASTLLSVALSSLSPSGPQNAPGGDYLDLALGESETSDEQQEAALSVADGSEPASHPGSGLGVQSPAGIAAGEGESGAPERPRGSGRRLALIGIPLIALAIIAAQLVPSRDGKVDEATGGGAREAFVPAAYFSPQTIDALSAEGQTFAEPAFIEDFANTHRNPALVVTDGRMTLATGTPSYSLEAWRAPRDAFAVPVDLRAEGGVRAFDGDWCSLLRRRPVISSGFQGPPYATVCCVSTLVARWPR